MEIKNISLALWDSRPTWDQGDGYSKYMDQIEPGTNLKQKDIGRYRIDMIAHDKNVAHKMACKLLWPPSRHTSGNQYQLHKEWYNEQFEYARELKDQSEVGDYDMIHPPLIGIPYRPGGKMNKRRVFEEPSIVIAMRMRASGDQWDQQTIHHWVILWRVKTGDQVQTLQFKIEDKKIVEGLNNTVCRRTNFKFCPIELPFGLFRYSTEEGTHIKDEQEADFLAEYKKHKIAEQKAAENYQSKFPNTNKNDKEMLLDILYKFLKNEFNPNDNELEMLMDQWKKHNIDVYAHIDTLKGSSVISCI